MRKALWPIAVSVLVSGASAPRVTDAGVEAGEAAQVEPVAPRARQAPLDARPGAQPARPPHRIRYELSARLDEVAHSVSGSGHVSWTNGARVATDRLYLHLYLNAFRDRETLFFRSPFLRARGGRLPARFGRMEIDELDVHDAAGRCIPTQLAMHSPGDPHDATDLRVDLGRPIAPGEKLRIDVSWRSILPSLTDRTGFSDDFHFVGQWFPKLARLEDDGQWAHFAFHPHGEFYADFADYDVRLDVDADAIVGATGTRVSEERHGRRRKLHYRAQSVIDFAWTAWPGFRERNVRVGDVAVRLLHPPGHQTNAEATLDAIRFALPHFESRYGAYPLDELTIVHPPRHAEEAGGMEYPGLITTGGPWHATWWSRAVQSVTVHELGHQWFHGLLASNEPRYPFLDEGLTTYAEMLASTEQWGAASAASLPGGFTLSLEAVHRQNARAAAAHLPIGMAAAEFPTFRDLGGLVYSRTALLLKTLANVYGPERMQRALASYASDQRYRHPRPSDLFAALERELGRAAADSARRAVLHGASVDYSVGSLRWATLPATRERTGEAGTTPGESSAPRIRSRVVVHRSGDLTFPVWVTLTTRAGESVRQRWDGQDEFVSLLHDGDSPVVTAVVDPDHQVLLDDDLLNNAKSHPPQPMGRSVDWAVYVTQLLLGLLEP